MHFHCSLLVTVWFTSHPVTAPPYGSSGMHKYSFPGILKRGQTVFSGRKYPSKRRRQGYSICISTVDLQLYKYSRLYRVLYCFTGNTFGLFLRIENMIIGKCDSSSKTTVLHMVILHAINFRVLGFWMYKCCWGRDVQCQSWSRGLYEALLFLNYIKMELNSQGKNRCRQCVLVKRTDSEPDLCLQKNTYYHLQIVENCYQLGSTYRELHTMTEGGKHLSRNAPDKTDPWKHSITGWINSLKSKWLILMFVGCILKVNSVFGARLQWTLSEDAHMFPLLCYELVKWPRSVICPWSSSSARLFPAADRPSCNKSTRLSQICVKMNTRHELALGGIK